MLYSLLRKILFRLDPETVHHFSLDLLQQPWFQGLLPTYRTSVPPPTKRELWGLTFPNPIGLAAGFDKNAVALLAWEKLGFGFIELGTVTRHAQPGNPRPRIFRIASHGALINRMGFPNDGADVIAARLSKRKAAGNWPSIPLGINLGKSKVTSLEEAHLDYQYSFRLLKEYADYFVINVSSPNTPGLRSLQGRDQLEKIVQSVQEENHRGRPKPLLIKIAPDLVEQQLDEVLEVIQLGQCAGVVATNTTLDKSTVPLKEEGGLSGAVLRTKSTQMIQLIAQKTGGKLPIIGVGGIFTGADAAEKLRAGAILLQGYTGFVYAGPSYVRNILKEIESIAA